jgi:hypothetical protein
MTDTITLPNVQRCAQPRKTQKAVLDDNSTARILLRDFCLNEGANSRVKLFLVDFDDFDALVGAAGGAHMVRRLVVTALGAANQMTQAQRVVGAAPVAAAAGNFSLW